MYKFEIHTESRNTYLVDEEDNMYQTEVANYEPIAKNTRPSGNWKALGVREIKPFGRLGELIGLEDVVDQDMQFKNGKGRYMLEDLDHGTTRIHSDRVVRVERADQDWKRRDSRLR